jgi:high-affinity K+ transport system ATPase subunit B
VSAHAAGPTLLDAAILRHAALASLIKLDPRHLARNPVMLVTEVCSVVVTVLFLRDLRSTEADDVQFAVGKAAPVAFAVWDGQNRDRNGRKVISNWLKLLLEK